MWSVRIDSNPRMAHQDISRYNLHTELTQGLLSIELIQNVNTRTDVCNPMEPHVFYRLFITIPIVIYRILKIIR